MHVRLYTREEAAHAPVLELADKWFRLESWECTLYRRVPCAHCDFDSPAVRRVRTEKLRRLRAFERTGWLSPTTLKVAGPLTETEIRRLCFPHFPKADPHEGRMRPAPCDKVTAGVVDRYLRSIGEKPDGTGGRWSCGCTLHRDSDVERGPSVEACDRHRQALVDGGE
jgi:hypothetical protein